MKMLRKILPFIVLVALLTWTCPSMSQGDVRMVWSEEGMPVTTAPDLQLRAAVTSDGSGGAIIVWEDWRIDPGNGDIYGQRISADGSTLWGQDGVVLINAPNINGEPTSQGSPIVISDGSGGAIFGWGDDRNLQADIYAQRVNAEGEVLWEDDGVPIATACTLSGLCINGKSATQISNDGSGGAIITWYEIRDGFHFSVWAQRVNADGETLWTLDGVPVAYGSFNADFPKLISDESGGAIIGWQDDRGDYRIFAQRLDDNGAPLWATNGIEVSPPIGLRAQGGHALISNGAEGAIVVWVDRRAPDYDGNIYVQRVNEKGEIQWQADGVPICTRDGDQYYPVLAPDGTGGAIIAWEDGPASSPGSGQVWIMAQRVNGSGKVLWAKDGVAVYTIHGFGPKMVSDGMGGAIIVWDGMRYADGVYEGPSIFAQRINRNGGMLWNENGVEIYHQPGGSDGFEPRLVDSVRGVIVFWKDYRDAGSYWDIYAQRLMGFCRFVPWFPLLLF
jgi:hypothetical protein